MGFLSVWVSEVIIDDAFGLSTLLFLVTLSHGSRRAIDDHVYGSSAQVCISSPILSPAVKLESLCGRHSLLQPQRLHKN
jgi:hypothetical protein